MPNGTDDKRLKDAGISSRRRFLTILLTAGAATILANIMPSVLHSNSSESSTVSKVKSALTNESTVNITVPTSSHISAVKSFPTNKTRQINATITTTSSTTISLTPLDDWYIVQIGPTPQVATSSFMLIVDGLVDNPLTITYNELIKMPSKTIIDNIACVSDPYFLRATVQWTGVPLKYILNMAGVKPNATKIITYGADGYTSDLPLWKAMEDDTLVAYMADGQPLLTSHGYPIRLFVPRWWGYKSVKWLVKITVTDENYLGYWESRGYPDIAKMSSD